MKTISVASALLTDGALLEEVVDDEQPKLLLQRPGGDVEVAESIEYGGSHFVPWRGSLVETGAVKLAGPPTAYGTVHDLIAGLRDFIHTYVQLTEPAEEMASWYILHTWTADQARVTPYLRFLDDYGRGKTRALETIGHLCHLAMFAAGATTPSPIFRMLEMFRGGTLVMDEADHRSSDLWADLSKILNQGYVAGWPVLRSEKHGGRFEPTSYDCFGPKLLATRGRFDDDALESRCLTYPMPTLSRRDITLILPPSFKQEALALRSKLLQYRLDRVRAVKVLVPKVYMNGLDPRLAQILEPMRHSVDDDSASAQLDGFALRYQRDLVAGRGQTLQARVTRAILGLQNSGKPLTLGNVADEANRDNEGEDLISSKKAGAVIRDDLRLETRKQHGRYRVLWDQSRVDELVNYYGLRDDEEEEATEPAQEELL